MINDDHPRDNDAVGFSCPRKRRHGREAHVTMFAFLQFDVYLHVNISLHLSGWEKGEKEKKEETESSLSVITLTTEDKKEGHLSVITPWTQ